MADYFSESQSLQKLNKSTGITKDDIKPNIMNRSIQIQMSMDSRND